MTGLIPLAMLGGVPATTTFEVLNSGAFAAEESDKQSRTFVTGDRKTWTFSLWVKRSNLSSAQVLLSTLGPGGFGVEAYVLLSSSDTIDWVFDYNGGSRWRLITSDVFRDMSEWYHLLFVADTTDATSGDRMKIYVNNRRITNFSTENQPSSSADGTMNYASAHYLGSYNTGASLFTDGYLAEVNFIDGQALTPEDFAEEDSVTGQWNPIEYAGTYGTTGFYLEFQNGADLGEDSSGNGNDFTNSGVIQSTDTPVDNHCILNGADPLTTATITDAGLTSASGNAKVSFRPENGKWYYEKDGTGVNYDCGVSGQFDPTLTAGTYAFTEDSWVGSPDVGFVALSTKNLPTPDIVLSGEYFAPFAYDDGAGAKTIGFQPDLVWMKSRGSVLSSRLVDSVRGAGKALKSDSEELQVNEATGLTSFDANGFTVGAHGDYSDQTGDGMMSWSWKKGAIPGFDIKIFSGTGVAHTESHSLSAVPSLMIVRRLFSWKWWATYHESMAVDPETDVMRFNDTTATADNVIYWNDTAPTSTVFTVGTTSATNASGTNNMIAYLFAAIEGFSNFGAYTGTGNASGPFNYCGFRPALVIIKCTNIGGTSWRMYDSIRGSSNVNETTLRVDTNLTEDTADSSNAIDFLSNGFKCRSTGSHTNGTGNTYIYMAFAESPFQYSRAR